MEFPKTNAAKNQLAQLGLKGRKEATNNIRLGDGRGQNPSLKDVKL